ncbi:MAG: AMP-binding protein [Pseudomonadota bacterium]
MTQPLHAIAEASSAVFSDGETRQTVAEIWRADQDIREDIGRTLVVACIDSDFGGAAIYTSLVYGAAVPIFFTSQVGADRLNDVFARFRPNLFICKPGKTCPAGFQPAFKWHGYQVYAAENQYDHGFHDALCLLATTSGSTGSAKMVRQSFDNVAINTQQIVRAIGIDRETTAITSLPIAYTFGMSTVNCQIFAHGALAISPHSITQKPMLDLMLAEQVTLLSGVPQTYQQLMQMRFFRSRYAASIQSCLQAGGKLGQSLEDQLRKTFEGSGKDFFVMYGQAEATTRMSVLPAADFLTRKHSAGKALDGGAFSILGADDTVQPALGEGRICYTGPNVALGYADESSQLKEGDDFDGHIDTGDIGTLDEDGYITITGRAKRFAKINGISINLADVEDILEQATGAAFACIEDQEVILAFHVAPVGQDVIEAARQRLGLLATNFQTRKIAEIPRLDNEKTHYPKLQRLAREGALTA